MTPGYFQVCRESKPLAPYAHNNSKLRAQYQIFYLSHHLQLFINIQNLSPQLPIPNSPTNRLLRRFQVSHHRFQPRYQPLNLRSLVADFLHQLRILRLCSLKFRVQRRLRLL